MSYREHPPGRLGAWIECFWTFHAGDDADPGTTTVYPDGCMDAIFDLGAPLPGLRDRVGRSFVVGTMRSALTYASPPGADLVGVRFRPGAVRAMVECDPAGLVDRRVALEDLWGREAGLVEEALVSMPTRARLAALAGALESRLTPRRADPLVDRAVRLAERARGRIGVAALARAVGRSERTLQRRFVDATGVGPKETCRVLRFRHAIRTLRERPGLGGARLAARCGYADQSHLIREFRSIAGATPAEIAGG